MIENLTNLSLVAILWLLYFLLHSLLASLGIKGWLQMKIPALKKTYRLIYNVLATLTILPPLWLTLSIEGNYLWRWEGIGYWLANGLALLSLAGFVVTSRAYDMWAFIGLKQDPSCIQLSYLHRWVRHPWYFLGLILLWTRDMNAAMLTASVIATLYLLIGSRLEDRKLVTEFGDAYLEYIRQVPGLIPRPWRHLSHQQLQNMTNTTKDSVRLR